LRGLAKRFNHRDHKDHGESLLKTSVDTVRSVASGFLATPLFLTQLRLQNLERLNLKRLQDFARRTDKPKWKRAETVFQRA
jgi:hypothetical protein